LVTELGADISHNILEDVFREKCIAIGTSMPEDIRCIDAIKLAYIIFPSISVCNKVYEALNGSILINGHNYKLDFTPNISAHQYNLTNPKKMNTQTFITNVSDQNNYTTSMETTVHEDWICEYVRIFWIIV
jgi:hypothetical protein